MQGKSKLEILQIILAFSKTKNTDNQHVIVRARNVRFWQFVSMEGKTANEH